ncbi:MAG: hypothetical protein WKF92_03590 [Pyrinomonadaceae bacterium]
MENPTSIQIIGDCPELGENSQYVIEDEIGVNSIVYFEKTDSNTTAVKIVDLQNLDTMSVPIYRAGKGTEPGQIIFEQIEIGALKESLAEQAKVDALLDQTLNNISFFYRDNDLGDEFINMYYRGLIVRELGFVDASFRSGGLAARHRFLIASSQAVNLSDLPPAIPEQGLVVIKNGSFFKVLDVFERENRKQITLLHIPEELVAFFSTGNELSDIELQIAEAARTDFDKQFYHPPADALKRADWLNRLKDPIGISDDGKYFYPPP